MCKLHGVRLVKGIKIFESMPKNQNRPSFQTKQLRVTFKHKQTWSVRNITVGLLGTK